MTICRRAPSTWSAPSRRRSRRARSSPPRRRKAGDAVAIDIHPPGKITFELVSPERLLLSQQVDMVVVPGSEGFFGVLIGHTPLISTLKPGVIEVYDGGKVVERIFVGGGFAEATPDRCV